MGLGIPNSFSGKRWGGGVEERVVKKEESEKEPEEDKDRSL